MSKKKVVGRNVVIGLGIVCIILAVGLVGAFADYTSIISGKDSAITTKDSQIASLNSQIASKDSQIASLNSRVTNLTNQLNDLNSTINDLNSTVNDLNSIVNLEKYTYWGFEQDIKQNANSYTTWATEASYAGYVKVNVESNNTNTYVRVIYSSSYGVNYDNQIDVGTGGIAVFPILPASHIQVRVGNTDLFNGATIGVEIIYYY